LQQNDRNEREQQYNHNYVIDLQIGPQQGIIINNNTSFAWKCSPSNEPKHVSPTAKQTKHQGRIQTTEDNLAIHPS
jgi:hypothetical protein